ncbi:unnamed protein product [Victoria cruziana]
MMMSNICSKLKALGLNLPDDFTVHIVLLSFPPQYGQFKVSYSYQKEKLTLSELICHCANEAERLKRDKTDSAHLATTPKFKKRMTTKPATVAEASTVRKQKKPKEKNSGCFLCKAEGHMKNDCAKYHAWREKKGLPKLPNAK